MYGPIAKVKVKPESATVARWITALFRFGQDVKIGISEADHHRWSGLWDPDMARWTRDCPQKPDA